MTASENNSEKKGWKPDKYIQIFQNLVDDYEKDHPYWQTEVFISLLQRGIRGLQLFIEKEGNTDVVWDSPFVNLDYPVEWNWEAPRVSESPDYAHSGLILGTITEENTRDKETVSKTLAEILVRRLNTLALANFTNDAWYEIKNEYRTPILPIGLKQELEAIKGKRARRKFFEQVVRPFSIGAATIDISSMKFEDGEKVSKRVAEQLQNINHLIDIDRIGISGNINGHEFQTSLIFQIHPLVADYDNKKAYHTIAAGLFFEPRQVDGEFVADTPARWSATDRKTFWSELDDGIGKLTDKLIPKQESQASQIFQINALLEIPLASPTHGDKNIALKSILDNLSQAGQVRKISVEPAKPTPEDVESVLANKKTPETENIPKNPTEGVTQVIWNSRFRIPLLLILAALFGLIALFAVLPEQSKLQILKLFGLH